MMDEDDPFAPLMVEFEICSPPSARNQISVQEGMYGAYGYSRSDRRASSEMNGFVQQEFHPEELLEGNRDGNDSILSSPTPVAQSQSRTAFTSLPKPAPLSNFRPAPISNFIPSQRPTSHAHPGIRALPVPPQLDRANRSQAQQQSSISNVDFSKSMRSNYQNSARTSRVSNSMNRLEATQGREAVEKLEADAEDYFGSDGEGFEEALNNLQDVAPIIPSRIPNNNFISQYPSTTINRSPVVKKSKQGVKLRPVGELPDMYRSIFKFGVFNAVQSTCFDTVYHSDSNVVVSAPTGAGKTVLFELAILRLFSTPSSEEGKVVYIAPTKSLCYERARDWKIKFERLGGVQVIELTGDAVGSLKDVGNARVIICTPEKWDAMTRKWHSHAKLLAKVRLVCIDEVHLVGENIRGAVLEVVVSRIKSLGTNPRFIALSATIPNIEDVSEWLKETRVDEFGEEESNPAKVFKFGDEFRPCPLQKIVLGFNFGDNEWVFRGKLNSKIMDIIKQYSSGKAVMIFCPTRKNCVEIATALSKAYHELLNSSTRSKLPWPRPGRNFTRPEDSNLAALVDVGISYHHAGLDNGDRRIVEQGFLDGTISIVCSTSTLAVGVNLPARMVLIAGTKKYEFGKGNIDYSELEILQMMGRAGRPQFDPSGIAVIATDYREQAKYERLVNCQTVVESGLHKSLTEHLNSEITLRTITSVDSALNWLRSTFLFVRIQQNPSYYSLAGAEHVSPATRLEQICIESVSNLVAGEIVEEQVDELETRLGPTVFGDMMSKYYLTLPTLLALKAIPPKTNMRGILEVISASTEFNDWRFRGGEKKLYAQVNKNLKFSCAQISTSADKVNILIQTVLQGIPSSELKIDGANPALDIVAIWPVVGRILKCLLDLSLENMDGVTTKSALELFRSISAKAWEGSPFVLRQLEGIGEKSIKVFSEKNINTLEDVRNSDSTRLEMIMNRNPPFGRNLIRQVSAFPRLKLSFEKISEEVLPGVAVRVTIKVILSLEVVKPPPITKKGKTKLMGSCLILTSDGEWIEFRRMRLESLLDGEVSYLASVDLVKPSQRIFGTFDCDEIAGVGCRTVFRPTTMSDKYPVPSLGQANAPAENVIDLIADSTPVLAGRSKSVSKLETEDTPDQPEPVKLSNGFYACNHSCADKTKCRHLCCREGTPKPPRPTRAKKTKASETAQTRKTSSGKNSASITSKKEAVVNSLDQLEGNKLDRPPVRTHRIPPKDSMQEAALKFSKLPGEDRFKAIPQSMEHIALEDDQFDELESSPSPPPPNRVVQSKPIIKKLLPKPILLSSSPSSPEFRPLPLIKTKAPRQIAGNPIPNKAKQSTRTDFISNLFNSSPLPELNPPKNYGSFRPASIKSAGVIDDDLSDSDLEMNSFLLDRSSNKRGSTPVLGPESKKVRLGLELSSERDEVPANLFGAFAPDSNSSSATVIVDRLGSGEDETVVEMNIEEEKNTNFEQEEEEEEVIFGEAEFELGKVSTLPAVIAEEVEDDFDSWLAQNVEIID